MTPKEAYEARKEALRAAEKEYNEMYDLTQPREECLRAAIVAYVAALPPHVEGSACRTCGVQLLRTSGPATEIDPTFVVSSDAGREVIVGRKDSMIVGVDLASGPDQTGYWVDGPHDDVFAALGVDRPSQDALDAAAAVAAMEEFQRDGGTPLAELVAELDADDGWTEWTGGARPVPHDTEVECRLRNGRVYIGRAGHQHWRHWHDDADSCRDIVAYRVVWS